MKITLHLSALVKYSSLSALTFTLASPLMAIERPLPAQQPEEKQEFQAQVDTNAQSATDEAPKAIPVPKPTKETLTYLGVYGSPTSNGLAAHFKIEKGQGLALELVAPNSPAEKAGLKRQDIILKIAGQDINNMDNLRKVLTTKSYGDKVDIDIIDHGKKVTMQITLSQRYRSRKTPAAQPASPKNLGNHHHPKEQLNRTLPEELLAKFPAADREKLIQLLEGNAMGQNFKDVEEQLNKLSEMKLNAHQSQPNTNNEFKGDFRSSVKMLGPEGSITLHFTPVGRLIEIFNKKGIVEFRGPYNDDFDKHRIPEGLRARVESLNIDDNMEIFNQPKTYKKGQLKKLNDSSENTQEGRSALKLKLKLKSDE